MKPGDIVICINNKNEDHLVIGQKYKVLFSYHSAVENDEDMIEIAVEPNFAAIYYSFRFKLLNRQKKLERILNETR